MNTRRKMTERVLENFDNATVEFDEVRDHLVSLGCASVAAELNRLTIAACELMKTWAEREGLDKESDGSESAA